MSLDRVNSPAGRVAATAERCWPSCGFFAASFSSEDDDDAAGNDMPGSRQLVLTVDQSGRGDHRRIQEAIDAAAPANDDSAAGSVVIRIKPGVYRQVYTVNNGHSAAVRMFISGSTTCSSN
jgi:pectinesterase